MGVSSLENEESYCKGMRLLLKLNGAVYKSYYARPLILYGSRTWRLKDSEMGNLKDR